MSREDRFANLCLRDDTDVADGSTTLEPLDNVAVVYNNSGPGGGVTISFGKTAAWRTSCM